MRREDADRRGTHQDAVAVVLEARPVAHVVDAELLRVAVDEEVLPDRGWRWPPADRGARSRVEAGVGVLLQPVEDGQVVLVAIGRVVAEEADAEVRVGEDEAAEVAVERLRPGADGDEVVVRREVAQLPLVEELLQRELARPCASCRGGRPA